MPVNHRILRLVFAFAIGVILSFASYRWISDTDRAARRAVEEAVVLEGRQILRSLVGLGAELRISDPLDRVRAAGKAYVFPTADGWELSGHYQRGDEVGWHPFLMSLDANTVLRSLTVDDANPELLQQAAGDPRLVVSGAR